MARAPKRRRSRQILLSPWIAPICAVVGALALVAIAAGVWLQGRSLHRIDRLLGATQRPWLGATIEPVQLVFDDKGGGITLKMTIKNGGAAPATQIVASPVLLLNAEQPFRNACRQQGVGGGLGPTLFKDETLPKTATVWLARADFKQAFPALVAVCIKYRFAGQRRRGESGYLFSIVRHEPSGAESYVVDTKNGTLIPPELVLLPIGSYQD